MDSDRITKDSKKAFDKIQRPLLVSNMIKHTYFNPKANTAFQGEMLEAFPKSRATKESTSSTSKAAEECLGEANDSTG